VLQTAAVSKSHVEIAVAWLRTLKAGTPAELATTTVLPFTFASTAKKKACEGTLKTEAALKPWLACVRKAQAAWLAELDVPGEPALAAATEGADPAKLAALMKKAAPKASAWVRASMSRDGVAYSFRFVVDDTGDVPGVAVFLLDVADSG